MNEPNDIVKACDIDQKKRTQAASIKPISWTDIDPAYTPKPRKRVKPQEFIHWSDMEVSAKCYPQRRNEALAWIRSSLLYLPPQHVFQPHLTFIQSLIENEAMGVITNDTFLKEIEIHLTNIRNDDMKKGEWVKHIPFREQDYEAYETHLQEYKNLTHYRLSELMGYEPALEHALEAEIFLRKIFASDQFYQSEGYTPLDYKALVITRYREVYMLKGEAIADKSVIEGVRYRQTLRNQGILLNQ